MLRVKVQSQGNEDAVDGENGYFCPVRRGVGWSFAWVTVCMGCGLYCQHATFGLKAWQNKSMCIDHAYPSERRRKDI